MSLAAAIEQHLDIKTEVVPGKRGQFEVFVDDELAIGKDQVSFFSRLLGNKGIPAEDKVLALLESRKASDPSAGRVDSVD